MKRGAKIKLSDAELEQILRNSDEAKTKLLYCWFRGSGDIQVIRYYAQRLKLKKVVSLLGELEKELQKL